MNDTHFWRASQFLSVFRITYNIMVCAVPVASKNPAFRQLGRLTSSPITAYVSLCVNVRYSVLNPSSGGFVLFCIQIISNAQYNIHTMLAGDVLPIGMFESEVTLLAQGPPYCLEVYMILVLRGGKMIVTNELSNCFWGNVSVLTELVSATDHSIELRTILTMPSSRFSVGACIINHSVAKKTYVEPSIL